MQVHSSIGKNTWIKIKPVKCTENEKKYKKILSFMCLIAIQSQNSINSNMPEEGQRHILLQILDLHSRVPIQNPVHIMFAGISWNLGSWFWNFDSSVFVKSGIESWLSALQRLLYFAGYLKKQPLYLILNFL